MAQELHPAFTSYQYDFRKKIHRQTGRQTDRQADRQTDRKVGFSKACCHSFLCSKCQKKCPQETNARCEAMVEKSYSQYTYAMRSEQEPFRMFSSQIFVSGKANTNNRPERPWRCTHTRHEFLCSMVQSDHRTSSRIFLFFSFLFFFAKKRGTKPRNEH